jgi:hypothetical protein
MGDINKMHSYRLFFYLSCALLMISSCQDDTNVETLGKINPTISVDVIRFEKELAQLNQEDLSTSIEKLSQSSPAFSEVYFRQIMALPEDPAVITSEVERMIADTGFVKLYDDVTAQYGDLGLLKKEIDQTIENYMTLFDVKEIPKVYTFISGFVYQGFLFDDVNGDGIGIGLDMFLGSQFPYAQVDPSNPAFSSYLTRSFDANHLTKKIAEVLVEDKLPPPSKSDFLSLMILGGKKLYLMDQILSFKPDSVIIEYTSDQLAWCKMNESSIWEFFFDKNLFYETDLRKFNKLVGPAPNSPGMPEEAPGRTGNYMGWQIVKAYMNRHPNTSITELLELSDAQKLLDDSKFKPRRAT